MEQEKSNKCKDDELVAIILTPGELSGSQIDTAALRRKSEQDWICCQIGAREHYAVARALHRHNSLRLLLTDAWFPPRGPLTRLKPSLRTRFHAELTTANVYAPNVSNL